MVQRTSPGFQSDQGVGLRVNWDLEFRASGLGCRAQDLEFRVLDFGLRVWC